MRKERIVFAVILLIMASAFVFTACGREHMHQPQEDTAPDVTEPVVLTEEKIQEPGEISDTADAALPDAAYQEEKLYGSWQEAYLDILCNAEDYWAAGSGVDPNRLREDYDFTAVRLRIVLHDFEGDGVPELVTGDDVAVSVFSFIEGKLERKADIYTPEDWGFIDGANMMGNEILLDCDGSDGCGYGVLAYRDGEYLTGRYCDYHPEETVINDAPASAEEFLDIFNIDYDAYDHLTWYMVNLETDCIYRSFEEWDNFQEIRLDQDFPFDKFMYGN